MSANVLRFAIALASFAVLSACATSGDAPGGQSHAAIGRPDVKIGDSWTYWQFDLFTRRELSFGVTRVVRADGHVIQTVTTLAADNKELDGIWTPDWNAVASAEDEVFRPHSGWLRFPLVIGTSYSNAYDVVRPRAESRVASFNEDHRGTATIVGWEDVDVPAGRFRAVKIEVDGKFSRYGIGGMRSGGAARIVIWYVPEVKRWVKFLYEDWTIGSAVPARRTNWWAFELVRYNVQ